MADVKSYIVNYDIRTDVTNATQGFRAIQEVASSMQAPMEAVAKSVSTVAGAVMKLKQNSSFVFEAKTNTSGFQKQLDALVKLAAQKGREAAAAWRTAMAEMNVPVSTFTGTVDNKMQKNAERRLNDLIRKYKNGIKINNGRLEMVKSGLPAGFNTDDAIKLAQREIQEYNDLIRQMEEAQKKAAAVANRKQKAASKKAPTATPAMATPAGFAPSFIQGMFKNGAKQAELTIKIVDKTQEKIGTILTRLKKLQEAGFVNVTPTINNEAFNVAGARLDQLLTRAIAIRNALSRPLVKEGRGNNGLLGLTSDEQSRLMKNMATIQRLTEGQKNGTLSANEAKTASMQIANAKKSAEKLLMKAANGVIPVGGLASAEGFVENVRQVAAQVTPSASGIKQTRGSRKPTGNIVPAQQQLAQLANTAAELKPVVTIDANILPALQKLAELINAINRNGRQTITISATGSLPAVNAATTGAATNVTSSGSGKSAATVSKPPTLKDYERAYNSSAYWNYVKDTHDRNMERIISRIKDETRTRMETRAARIADIQAAFAQQEASRRATMMSMTNPLAHSYVSPKTRAAQKVWEQQQRAAKVADYTGWWEQQLAQQEAARRQALMTLTNPNAHGPASQKTREAQRKWEQQQRSAYVNDYTRWWEEQMKQQDKIRQAAEKQRKQALAQQQKEKAAQKQARQRQEAAMKYRNIIPVDNTPFIPLTGAEGGGVRGGYYGGRVARKTPFYDRVRKAAYPFTGNTSFGARTPMAVDMAKGMGVMFAVGGAMSAVGNSLGQAMEYQNVMETAKAILKNNYKGNNFDADFNRMANTVRRVGIETKFSAPEVGDAAKFLAMAGMDIEMINNSIRPVADVALVGDLDLGTTADKLTNIMTAFELQNKGPQATRRMADMLTATFTRHNVNMMQLAESAQYAAPIAYTAGMTPEEMLAIVGIMGDAGIQGSMAGTSLRMILQNVLKPSKPQKQTWDALGIQRFNADGTPRNLIDILSDVANKVPEDKLIKPIMEMFRVTSAAGATQVIRNLKQVKDQVNYNRNSEGISMTTADAKKNTMRGMWAQVTSTFTEGIVQAFEERQGGLTGMLKDLRNYLARPETVQMLKNVVDLAIELGKVIAFFVNLWGKFYSMFPGVVKLWMITQMFFTQLGQLATPFVSLIGVFSRLKQAALGLSSAMGVRAAAGGAAAATGTAVMSRVAASNIGGSILAGGAVYSANTALGRAYLSRTAGVGLMPTVQNAMAQGGRSAMSLGSRADVVSAVLLGGAVRGRYADEYAKRAGQYRRLHNNTMAGHHIRTNAAFSAQRYNEAATKAQAIRDRANRIYGFRHSTGRAFTSSFRNAATMGLRGASAIGLAGGIKSVVGGLGSMLGLLANPITLAVGAVGALAFAAWKAHEAMVKMNNDIKESAKKNGAQIKEMIDNNVKGVDNLSSIFSNIQTIQVGTATINVDNQEKTIVPLSADENYKEIYDVINGKLEDRHDLHGNHFYWLNSNIQESTLRSMYDNIVAPMLPYNPELSQTYDQSRRYVKGQYYNRAWRANVLVDVLNARTGQKALESSGYLETRDKIVALYRELANMDEQERIAKSQEYFTQIRQLAEELNPQNHATTRVTLENIKETSKMSPALLESFWVTQYNAISQLINDGNIIKSIQAMNELSGTMTPLSEEFYTAIGNIAGSLQVFATNSEGIRKEFTLPFNRGKLDLSKLSQYIKANNIYLGNNLEQYVQMLRDVYNEMLKIPGMAEKLKAAGLTEELFVKQAAGYGQGGIWSNKGTMDDVIDQTYPHVPLMLQPDYSVPKFEFKTFPLWSPSSSATDQSDYRSNYAPTAQASVGSQIHFDNLVNIGSLQGGDGVSGEELAEVVGEKVIEALQTVIESYG